jgi:hypothetical protein
MSGRIRPGVYVLSLIRLRNCGNFGDMTHVLLKLGSYHRYCCQSRSLRGTTGGYQSPSGFKSRR